MSDSLPSAKSVPKQVHSNSQVVRKRLRRVVQQRELCGLANDTKWDELLSTMRWREGWNPCFRSKCIDGPPSLWDGEWFYHPPFPLISVEWLDIAYIQTIRRGALIAPIITDHSAWIEESLQRIGLEYQKGSTMIRVFGYSPKSLELFDQLSK